MWEWIKSFFIADVKAKVEAKIQEEIQEKINKIAPKEITDVLIENKAIFNKVQKAIDKKKKIIGILEN